MDILDKKHNIQRLDVANVSKLKSSPPEKIRCPCKSYMMVTGFYLSSTFKCSQHGVYISIICVITRAVKRNQINQIKNK